MLFVIICTILRMYVCNINITHCYSYRIFVTIEYRIVNYYRKQVITLLRII